MALTEIPICTLYHTFTFIYFIYTTLKANLKVCIFIKILLECMSYDLDFSNR